MLIQATSLLSWKGRVEEVASDARSCYAHSEHELGLMRMFGGFLAAFFSEHHWLIPKTKEYKDCISLISCKFIPLPL